MQAKHSDRNKTKTPVKKGANPYQEELPEDDTTGRDTEQQENRSLERTIFIWVGLSFFFKGS